MEAFEELRRSVLAALENYSNIHRGSGHNSMVTTYLYEQARDIVLNYLGLNKSKYVVIFCSPRRAEKLKTFLKPESYRIISSCEIGFSIGVRALAVRKKSLPKGKPIQTGGGATKLVAREWVIWANAPDKFEAGTPAIINIIAFAKALLLIKQFGVDAFNNINYEKHTAGEILFHDKLEQFSGHEMLDELKKTLIGSNLCVPTIEGSKTFTNLDNAATTPTFEPVWDAARQTWQAPLQVQQEIINVVKSICANFLGASLAEYDMIFTSNTTEAINLTAESLSKDLENGYESVVLNTILEHNSNDLPWRFSSGLSLIRLNVDNEGFVDLGELEEILSRYNHDCSQGKKRIKLVAVSGASNVLGVSNDLSVISQIVHQYGARLLVDAAQLIAHRKIDMKSSGIDYLAFSAHKIYAPFGTGMLVARKGLLNFKETELELIKSSGEENSGGIAALGKALVLLSRVGLDLIQAEEYALTVRTLQGLSQINGIKIYGIDLDSSNLSRKCGVIVFEIKGVYANVIAKRLADQAGIAVRYGCHCAHLMIKRLLKVSPFLEQFQGLIITLFPKINLPGVTRVSLGIGNSEADVDILIDELSKIASQPRIDKSKHNSMALNGTPLLSQKEIDHKINNYIKTVAQKVYG